MPVDRVAVRAGFARAGQGGPLGRLRRRDHGRFAPPSLVGDRRGGMARLRHPRRLGPGASAGPSPAGIVAGPARPGGVRPPRRGSAPRVRAGATAVGRRRPAGRVAQVLRRGPRRRGTPAVPRGGPPAGEGPRRRPRGHGRPPSPEPDQLRPRPRGGGDQVQSAGHRDRPGRRRDRRPPRRPEQGQPGRRRGVPQGGPRQSQARQGVDRGALPRIRAGQHLRGDPPVRPGRRVLREGD